MPTSDHRPERSYGTCTSIFGHRNILTLNKIRTLTGTGIQCLEISALQQLHLNLWDDQQVNELVKGIPDTGLAVWSLHAPFCAIAMDDPETRADGVRQLVKAAVVAHRFGSTMVVVHPGRDVPSKNRQQELDRTVAGMLKALKQCPPAIRLALETMGKNGLAGPPAEMAWVMERLPADRVGVCLDTGHTNLGFNVVEYIRNFTNRIFSVHLQDNHGQQDDHLLPGQGQLNWPAIRQALGATGYHGPLVNEGGDSALEPAASARQFTRFMQALERTDI